jgi:uncharacterized protein
LAGRAAILNLLPMSYRELSSGNFNSFITAWVLDEQKAVKHFCSTQPIPLYTEIWHGGYPKIKQLPDDLISTYWSSYMQTYVERDIRTIANIGSLQSFGDFFALLSAYTAQEINYTHLGREFGIDRGTAKKWLEIAQSTFQWFSIPPFHRNAIKKLSGKSKGYFADTGFLCYLQKISSPDVIASHPFKGRLVETYVALEIMKSFQGTSIQPNYYHFRTYSGAEVDLILEIDGWLYPIEIKSKTNPSKKDAMGIRSFKENFPGENIATGLVICAIEEPTYISKDILAVPWWII